MQFCVDRINCADNLRPHNGILRGAALVVTSDASVAAESIIARAHDKAQTILQQAHKDAESAVNTAEQRVIADANVFLEKLEHAHAVLLDHAQDIVIDLTQSLFDRLVGDMTPRQRIESSLKLLLREAPSRLVNPQLRVHPDDIELLPDVEWELKPDVSLTPGACRLEASTGEWYADFNAGVAALKQALTKASRESLAE